MPHRIKYGCATWTTVPLLVACVIVVVTACTMTLIAIMEAYLLGVQHVEAAGADEAGDLVCARVTARRSKRCCTILAFLRLPSDVQHHWSYDEWRTGASTAVQPG